MFDIGCDLIFGGESFVFRRIDFIFFEYWKGGFDVEFFDVDFLVVGRYGFFSIKGGWVCGILGEVVRSG